MADREKVPKAGQEKESKSVLKISFEKFSFESQNIGTRGQLFGLLAGLVFVFMLVRLATGSPFIPKQLTDLIVAVVKLRLGIP
jgi:hypothetical protein